jgi:hypothetical protein
LGRLISRLSRLTLRRPRKRICRLITASLK